VSQQVDQGEGNVIAQIGGPSVMDHMVITPVWAKRIILESVMGTKNTD
jgi:hypothetical protein